MLGHLDSMQRRVANLQVGDWFAALFARVAGLSVHQFDTFSTASLEAVHLWVNDGRRDAVAYVLVTLVGSLSAAAIGLSLV